MFDDLIIDKVHLPNELKDYEKGWQTKSLDCYMNLIKITENGALLETEYNNDENNTKPIYHTGEIIFYQDINKKWYQFVGFFDDGILFRLIQTSPVKSEENNTNASVSLKEIEDFFFEMREDFILWDEEEKGQYPMQRTFDAMKNFIESKKRTNTKQ